MVRAVQLRDHWPAARDRVKTRITMPHWPGYDSAPDADQREWDRFLAALKAHEQGHVDLVLQRLTARRQVASWSTAGLG
jgi:predicted secreted Zn-dependent protease